MIINTINLFRKPVSIIYIQGLIFFTTFRFVNFTTTLCGFETYCIVNILLYAIRYYNKTLMPWKNSIMSSWVLDEEKLLTVDQNYIRESLSTINTYFIYINKNDYIDNIIHEETEIPWDVNTNVGVIPSNVVLKIIQQKRHTRNGNVYTYDDTWLYLVDLEPEHIQGYADSTTETSTKFLKQIPPVDDIVIHPSIFVFHDVNALYFTFRESINKTKKEFSILKIKELEENNNKTHSKTKKRVRIVLPTKLKKTRKYLEK